METTLTAKTTISREAHEPQHNRTGLALKLSPPRNIRPSVYFFTLLGPLLLSAAFGVQVLLAALLWVPPPARPLSDLSGAGLLFTFPEWDIVFYLASIILSLVTALGLAKLWNRRLQNAGSSPSERFLVRQTFLQMAIAGGGIALYLQQFSELQSRVYFRVPVYHPEHLGETGSYLAVFATISALTVGAALLSIVPSSDSRSSRFAGLLDSDNGQGGRSKRFSVWDLVIPAAIVLLVYVPSWRQVAGRLFLTDTLLHWDYFAMGPALAFRHGLDIGTEIHSAYGVGWPLVFAAISGWIPLSYGQMIHIGSIYACLYLIGVYLLLRMLVNRPVAAALGTLLAMTPFFMGTQGLLIWLIPNVSLLRWPFDIWCFFCLVMYLRTDKRGWALAGGAMVGLALIFAIDTGAQLAAAVAFFWLGVLGLPNARRRPIVDFLQSALAALVVLVLGLAIAGRGDIFSTDFLFGWLEAALVFGSGFGMNPIVTAAHPLVVAGFVAVTIGYLTVAAYALIRLIHRRITGFELVTGLLALYGLLVLVRFAGQTSDMILPRLLMPAAMLLTILLDSAATRIAPHSKALRWAGSRPRLMRSLPQAMLLGVLALLVAGPGNVVMERVSVYPNLLTSQVSGTPEQFASTGICLIQQPKDLCGMPAELKESAVTFNEIVERLRQVKRSGHSFAVIDETGSLFHVATDTAPFGRYSRLFTTVHTKERLQEVTESFRRNAPEYVLLRRPIQPGTPAFTQWANFGVGPLPDSPFIDAWRALGAVVQSEYELELENSPFQLWVRQTAGPSP